MLDRPLSDLCSTVSCYALLLSAILPYLQAQSVQVLASSHSFLQVDHQQPRRNHNPLLPSRIFHLSNPIHNCEPALSSTVYLESQAQKRWLSPLSNDLLAQRGEQQHRKPCDRDSKNSRNSRGRTSRFSDVRSIYISKAKSNLQPTRVAFRAFDKEECHVEGCTTQWGGTVGAASKKRLRKPFNRPRCPSRLQNSPIQPDRVLLSSSMPICATESTYCGSQRSPIDEKSQAPIIRLVCSLGVSVQSVVENTGLSPICLTDKHLAPSTCCSTRNNLPVNTCPVSIGQATVLQDYEEYDSVGEVMLQFEGHLNHELHCSSRRQTNQHQRGCSESRQRPVPSHKSMGSVIHTPSMMPTSMPLEWITLMACGTFHRGVEHTLRPGVTAFILYPTLADDCLNLMSTLKGHTPPVWMIADLENAEQLVSTVESSRSGSLLMDKISNDPCSDQHRSDKELEVMEARMYATTGTSDHNPCERVEQARSHDVSEKRGADHPHKGLPFTNQEEYHEDMILSLWPPSVLEIKKSDAAFDLRQDLVTQDTRRPGENAIASDSKHDTTGAMTTGPQGRDEPKAFMASTSYSAQSSNAPFSRHVRSRFAHDTANDKAIPKSTIKGLNEITMATAAATSTPACLRSRGKRRAEFQEESDFPAPPHQPNAATRFNNGQGPRVRRIAQSPLQAGAGASPSFFSSSQLAYISGKIALVLVSTICLIGVIIFGALLFVVAVKVRLFRTRRSSNLYSHSARQFRSGHHHQQQPLGRNLNSGSSNKKVVPQHVLERFKVQTVLQTSPTSVALSAAVTHRRSRIKREKIPCKPACTENTLSMEAIDSFRTRNQGRAEVQVQRQQVQERRPSLEGSERLPTAVAPGGESEKGNGEDISDEEDVRSESDVEVDSDMEEAEPVIEQSDDAEQSTPGAVMSRGRSRRVTFDRQGRPNALSPISEASSDSSYSSSSLHSSVSERLSGAPMAATAHNGHRRKNKRRRPMAKQGPLDLPFANANAQTACSICLTEYEVGEQVRTLPCFHQYHQGCIDPWLLYVVSLCPMCKRDLHPAPALDSSIAPPLSPT